MKTTNISRKDFLSGALASIGLGAFSGRPIFAVETGSMDYGELKLTFGVVSDTHLRQNWLGEPFAQCKFYSHYDNHGFTDESLRNALAYFKSQNVDAVMHCGDMADRGLIQEMELHREAWDAVFNDGPAPVRLFVLGNHDVQGHKGGSHGYPPLPYAEALYRGQGDEWKKHILHGNLASAWQGIWGENYSDVWHKTVKGYHFFGMHHKYDDDLSGSVNELANQIRHEVEVSHSLDASKPFFVVTHIRQDYRYNNTDLNSSIADALGGEKVEGYGNGILFFGHSHGSVASWENVTNGFEGHANAVIPNIQCCSLTQKDRDPVSPRIHGFLVKVYARALVIRCIDFAYGNNSARRGGPLFYEDGGMPPYYDHHCASLGPDWVMPLPQQDPGNGEWHWPVPGVHPFSRAALEEAIKRPEFHDNARLVVEYEGDNVIVAIPNADGNLFPDGNGGYTGSRVYHYEIEIAGAGGIVRKTAFADGFEVGVGQEPNGGVTTVAIHKSELPNGENLTFRVYPCSSLGTRGKPLCVTQKVIRVSLDKSVPNVGHDARFALTNGAKLADDAKIVAECPPWVKRVCVEDGEIVAYTRPIGATVNVK